LLAARPGIVGSRTAVGYSNDCEAIGSLLNPTPSRIAAVRKPIAALGYIDEKVMPAYISESSLDVIDRRLGERSRIDVAMKRGIDFAVALVVLAFGLPFHALLALLIKLTSEGPVLFVQERIGEDGRKFRMYKYRTMMNGNSDEAHRSFAREFINGTTNGNHSSKGVVFKIVDDPRVTSIGKFLRKTSLDELPQFVNVLRGEMSLVGPRPPLTYELDHYKEWHKRRLSVKPGLTGLWQVSRRSTAPFDEMVALDLLYIENWSLLLDVKIILRTVPVMLSGFGGY
jgi:lipopolysaccharide/colanic/teichoic acid biosynthesis glycosyltransferase